MRLHKREKMLLIIASGTLLLGASSCDSSKVPEHNPCLIYTKENICISYRLVDPVNLTYAKDKTLPLESLEGGFGLPKGQFQRVIQYLRENKCDKALKEMESGISP